MTTSDWMTALANFDRHLAAAGRAATTREARRYHLHQLADQTSAPTTVTLGEIETWLATPGWAANTRKGKYASVRGFFAWLHATGQRADNPAALLSPVSGTVGTPRPVPDTTLRRALAECDDRARLMLELGACAGLRRAEIAGVRGSDVEDGIGGAVLRVAGKGGRVRRVPIADPLADRLREHAGWVFPSPRGGHLTPAHVGKVVGRLLPRGWTTHTLRHRFASTAYSADRDLRAVQELLGHASVATTQVYTAVPHDAARRAAAAASLAA